MKTKRMLPLPQIVAALQALDAQKDTEIAGLKEALAVELLKRERLLTAIRGRSSVTSSRIAAILNGDDASGLLDPIEQIQIIIAHACGEKDLTIFKKRSGRLSRHTWMRHLGLYLCYKEKLGPQVYLEKRFGFAAHGILHHALGVIPEDIKRGEHKLIYDHCMQRIREMHTSRTNASGGGA